LIAAEFGDVHEQYVWRFLRAQKIDPVGRKSWCESDNPEFVTKAADVRNANPRAADGHCAR
jgi:hypothetical protein